MLDKDYTFEILSEEDEEIDIEIDKIKEFTIPKFTIPKFAEEKEIDMWHNRMKINELIKAVKQLNKKIKE